MAGWNCSACDAQNIPGTRFCGYCGTRRAERSGSSDDALAAALDSIPDSVAAARVQAGADNDERRVVTSLFADVSGFTTLADRLEPDELHEIIAPVIADLAAVGDKYEGFIAKYAGDALLIFFGAPIAHEDDPTRALLTALEMHEALPHITAKLPPDAQGLSLHIGINTGRVISGRYGGESRADYSILGDAVILAQRLESVAGSGETYVGPTTYELTKDEFRYESLGELQLKGKLRPVQAYRLLGRRRTVAFSGVALDPPKLPLVGRDAELAIAWSLLDRMADGRGGALAVVGEPGVGKSRLMREIRDQSGAAGVRWYQGRCVSYGSGLAYHPFTDLLRQVGGISAGDEVGQSLERLDAIVGEGFEGRAYLASLLGLGADELRDLTPEAFRRGLHEAIASWLRSLASGGPVVVAIEDVHWADGASVALLEEMQRTLADVPILFYLTARPEGRERITPVVDAAGGRARVLDLEPLGEQATRDLVFAILGSPPPIELLSVVLQRATGNPLFVEELVRALQEQEALVERDGRWRLVPGWDASTIPGSIEAVLASRLDALPTTEAQTLQLAAVVGRVVPLALAALLLADQPDAEPALERLVERGMLDRTVFVGEPAVMFSHALVHDVAYGRLLKRTRRDLHRKVASVLKERFGDAEGWLDYLARQHYLGEMGAEAVDYLVRAGERAKRLYANEAAIEHYRRALEVVEGVDDLAEGHRDEVALALAEIEELVGHYDMAQRLYEERLDARDVRAWRGMASVLRKQGAWERVLAIVDDALRREWDADGRSQLLLERAGALMGLGRLGEAIDDGEHGLALATDQATRAELELTLARAQNLTGRYEDALRHARTGLETLEQIGSAQEVASALRLLGGCLIDVGEPAEAVRALRRAFDLASRSGSIVEIGASLINLGLALQEIGELDEAIDCDIRAGELFAQCGHLGGEINAKVNLSEKLLRAGRYDEVLVRSTTCLALCDQLGHAIMRAEVLDTMAGALAALGRADEANERISEAAALFDLLGNDTRAAQVRARIVPLEGSTSD